MDFEKQTCEIGSPFASRSIGEHILRGVIGLGSLGIGIYLSDTHPWALIPLGLVALVAFRGCPMCWIMGLIETLGQGIRRP